MATSDQLTRLAAARFDFEMKFYVGGPYEMASLDTIVAGGAYTPTVATTLDGDHDEDDTEITVDDTTGFATGFVVIEPEGSGEYYELIGYTTTTSTKFQVLTRDETLPVEALRHSDGATVSEWIDVTDNVLRMPTFSIDDRGQIVDWRVILECIGYNSVIFANDRAILGMWRFRPKDGDIDDWTDWAVAFLGYIKSANLTDTYLEEKGFVVEVGSLGVYVSSTDIPGRFYGRTDLAEGKSVTVKSVIEDPLLELDAGEYIGSPDLSGDMLVDDDIGTLWVSEGEPTSTPAGWANSETATINEVYLRPPVWHEDDDLIWFEISWRNAAREDGTLYPYFVVAKCTTWKNAGWIPDRRIPNTNYLDLGCRIPDEGFVIVCSNKPKFLEKWPNCGAHVIIDWRKIQEGTFTIEPNKDFIGLHWHGADRTSIVWFRNNDTDPTWVTFDYTGGDPVNPGPGWTGAPIPTELAEMPLGHSMRRYVTNDKDDPDLPANFDLDPGAGVVYCEDHPTPGNHLDGAVEWAKIDMGLMGIELDEDLAYGEVDQAVLTASLGLTEGPGDVKIDAEIIGYATRDDANLKLLTLTRAKYGTTQAAHSATATVEQYEDGAATEAHLISSLRWRRRPILDETGSYYVIPINFDIYSTTYASPVMPEDAAWDNGPGSGGWQDYWELLTSVRNYPTEQTSFQLAFDPLRSRQVMICIYDMSDGGRVKLNEFEVFAATGTLSGENVGVPTWDGTWTGAVIQRLLEDEFGLGSGLFTLTDPGQKFIGLPTTRGRALEIISEILERSGCQLIFHKDHHVEHRFHPLYPLFTWPDIDVAWTRTNARQVQYEVAFKHNVSQVTLRASDDIDGEVMEAVYPAAPLIFGSELNIEDILVGSAEEAALMAEMHFYRANSAETAVVIPVGPAEFVMPGDRHTITWTMDEEGTLLQGSNFIVAGVNYSVDFGGFRGGKYDPPTWNCSITMRK